MHSNCLRVDRYHPSFSLVLGIGNQIQVIANSSDPIGGVPIWNTTLDTYARSIGLALSADNSTGDLFVSFVIAYVTNDRYNVSLMAMAPLAQGVPGFSPLWTQRVVVASRNMYCGGASFCPLTPVVCGTQVLLTTPTAIMAFDQATGSPLDGPSTVRSLVPITNLRATQVG